MFLKKRHLETFVSGLLFVDKVYRYAVYRIPPLKEGYKSVQGYYAKIYPKTGDIKQTLLWGYDRIADGSNGASWLANAQEN